MVTTVSLHYNDDNDAANYGVDNNDDIVNGRPSLLLFCLINILKLDKFQYINLWGGSG